MRDEDYAALGLQAPLARKHPPTGPHDVASLIDRAAARFPHSEALADSRVRYTFAELAGAVDAIAGLFHKSGVAQGDRIAASLGNSCDLVIAFFAAMRIGAVWVGINKILPAREKEFILTHSGTRLLITDTSISSQIEGIRGCAPDLKDVWVLDQPARDGGWAAALEKGPAETLRRIEIDRFAPAAIMYTSGTTGTPKGVVHSQHNMVVVPAASFSHGMLAPDARRGSALPLTITNVLILGPISSFWNFRPFCMGETTRTNALVDWLKKEDIGEIHLVPAIVHDLAHGDFDLSDELHIDCGGAPLPPTVREAFTRRYGCELHFNYGLTEAPTLVARSRRGERPDGATGQAMPHLEISIRADDGTELPAGEVGEICFRAIQDGPWANVYAPPLGYWREPERTCRLLRDGVVHSGDHGRLDSERRLTVVDRGSELILRGGSNVYPAEIERVLRGHAAVADCAVVGKPDARMGKLTVACIQPTLRDANLEQLRQELEAICQDSLARYKMPDEWRFMESFPRNAMGKILKRQLEETANSAAGSRSPIFRQDDKKE